MGNIGMAAYVFFLHQNPSQHCEKRGDCNVYRLPKTTFSTAFILAAGLLWMSIVPQQAFAHGFIEKPGSRAALCSEAFGFLNLNCGSVMYEPQSLEAKKGFRIAARQMDKLHPQAGCSAEFLISSRKIAGLNIS